MGFKQSGHLLKMEANISPEGYVEYQLPLDEERVPLNQFIGQPISLEHLGDIHCFRFCHHAVDSIACPGAVGDTSNNVFCA